MVPRNGNRSLKNTQIGIGRDLFLSQIYTTCAFSPADAFSGFILVEFIIDFLYDCQLWIRINLLVFFHNLYHFIILYFES